MVQESGTGMFGDLLRFFRGQTVDKGTGKPLSQDRFAYYLSEKTELPITRNRENNWENNKNQPHAQKDRDLLIAIVVILHKYRGIKTLEEANQLLEAGKYQLLTNAEVAEINPVWISAVVEEEKETNIEEKSSGNPPKRNDQAKPVIQVPPLPPQGVFGRDDEINKIASFLAADDRNIVNISPLSLRGMGGIGKTTLAIAFAHAYRANFPDGLLWTSLGPKPTPRLLLDAWGRSLGLDLLPERDEAACQNRLRQFLYDKQVLIIIDDVWDTIPGGYFLVGGPNCRTLITTRELPIANNLATRERVLRVDVLKPEAALALLQKLAPETSRVDKAICMRLCERLEFLPLAITLAGRMLANEADVPQRMNRLLGELIERRDSRMQLVQAEGRQGLDEENPVSLQAILGMSVGRLDKPDQERFAMLSIFGGEPLTWELNAVSAVWEASMTETEATISRFIHRGLVEPRDGRYWMHALLADYAAELMKTMDL